MFLLDNSMFLLGVLYSMRFNVPDTFLTDTSPSSQAQTTSYVKYDVRTDLNVGRVSSKEKARSNLAFSRQIPAFGDVGRSNGPQAKKFRFISFDTALSIF